MGVFSQIPIITFHQKLEFYQSFETGIFFETARPQPITNNIIQHAFPYQNQTIIHYSKTHLKRTKNTQLLAHNILVELSLNPTIFNVIFDPQNYTFATSF